MKTVSLLVCLGASLVACDAFAVQSPPTVTSSALAASTRTDAQDVMQGFGRFAAAAALSLVIFANPAPSLADGMSSKLSVMCGVKCSMSRVCG